MQAYLLKLKMQFVCRLSVTDPLGQALSLVASVPARLPLLRPSLQLTILAKQGAKAC